MTQTKKQMRTGDIDGSARNVRPDVFETLRELGLNGFLDAARERKHCEGRCFGRTYVVDFREAE